MKKNQTIEAAVKEEIPAIETVEQAAVRENDIFFETQHPDIDDYGHFEKGFIRGANWRQRNQPPTAVSQEGSEGGNR